MLIDHYNSFVKAEYSPLMYEIGATCAAAVGFCAALQPKMANKAKHSDSFSVAVLPPIQNCECWQHYETRSSHV